MPLPRTEVTLARELERLPDLDLDQLRARWRQLYETEASPRLSRSLLTGAIAYKMQENAYGGLSATNRKFLRATAEGANTVTPTRKLKPGTVLLREWQGVTHEVAILEKGVLYRGKEYGSLSGVARLISGIHRSGPEFLGLTNHGKT